MSAFRRLTARHPSVALLLSWMLLVKLLTPIGWMPAIDARGVHLEMCNGFGPPPPAMHMAMQPATGGMPAEDHGNQHGKAGAEQPCAFAGLWFAAAPDNPLVISQPFSRLEFAPGAIVTAGIGTGLAAPPPPSTGPPVRT